MISNTTIGCIFLSLFLCLPSPKAHAALAAKGNATITEAYNPKPDSADVVLPMPCDLSMVFKIVGVPAQGFLWDLSTRFGHDNAKSDDRAYYDSRYTASLAAPFSKKDLPKPWRDKAPTGDFYYYLIGKYEVTALQYESIMSGQCPAPTAENIRPQKHISWYDATEFTKKYTAWLLENAPENLPHYQGDNRNVGYIRLPTEIEWEYAARGGQAITSQQFLEEFPLVNPGENYTDYAVFRPENATRIEEDTARIGSRKANKLGIYDTAGNVAEMVMDVFRFSLGGRLHGSAGGFVRKGGSYLSGLEEILPGRREEVAFFQIDGPVVSRDMGFRLAISGINTPGGDRQEILQAEWGKAGTASRAVLNKDKDPLKEIDRLIANATTDAERENYQHMSNILKENFIAIERQQRLTAASEIRNMSFLMEAIKNLHLRSIMLTSTLRDLERLRNDPDNSSKFDDLDKSIKKAKSAIENFQNAVKLSLQFYKTKLADIRTMDTKLVDGTLESVKKELESASAYDSFSKSLYHNTILFHMHLISQRNNNFRAVSLDQLEKDILKKR